MRRVANARGAAFASLLLLSACAAGTVQYSPSYGGGPSQSPGRSVAPHIVSGATAPAGAAVTASNTSSQALSTTASSPSGDELAFVTDLAQQMQRRSFAANAETCGYVGRDAQGRMMASEIVMGSEASCRLPNPPAGMRVAASIHTHGTYSPAYESEFPTVQDMSTDMADGIGGYISTPGGRLWHVDSPSATVRQLCGRGCLVQDPRYRPEDDGDVRQSYTYRELQAREDR